MNEGYTAIPNDIMEALAHIRISGEARQVLDVILRKTFGWNKESDWIALPQFAKATGMKKVAICKAISKLKSMKLIITKKDNADNITYCINTSYDKWKSLPKKVTLPKKVITVTKKGNGSLPKKSTTKETITKETITKQLYGEHVLLSHSEYQKLVEKYGVSETHDMIDGMNIYAESKPKKFKEYDSHYKTLLNWKRLDEKRRIAQGGIQPTNKLVARGSNYYTRKPDVEVDTDDDTNN